MFGASVALSAGPHRLTATVIGGDRNGVNGLDVAFRIGSRALPGVPCGSGCYAAAVESSPTSVAVVVNPIPQ